MPNLSGEKNTRYMRNDDIYVASSEMQGWSRAMEDKVKWFLEAPQDPSCGYFSLFDGHSGSAISEYACENLHEFIMNTESYREGRIPDALREVSGKKGMQISTCNFTFTSGDLRSFFLKPDDDSPPSSTYLTILIRTGFLSIDVAMKEDNTLGFSGAGSTAVVVLIKGNNVFCANVGDSKIYAFIDRDIIQLSTDHLPSSIHERERIRRAGCFIFRRRVNGCLSMSRALGDYIYKANSELLLTDQAVSSEPDLLQQELDSDWKFLLLMSDGLLERLDDEEIAEHVASSINDNVRPERIVEELLDLALSPDGEFPGVDNMSVILVVFLKNIHQPYLDHLMKDPLPKGIKKTQTIAPTISIPSTSKRSDSQQTRKKHK